MPGIPHSPNVSCKSYLFHKYLYSKSMEILKVEKAGRSCQMPLPTWALHCLERLPLSVQDDTHRPGASRCGSALKRHTAIGRMMLGPHCCRTQTTEPPHAPSSKSSSFHNHLILGQDQSSTLLYGNERLPTISLTLALPDGRSVDLERAPVTDQQGVAGLTGKVDQHFWRLFGAVFIGGALRGGAQLVQLEAAQAGGIGQVAGGIAATGSQATQQRLGRALDTRPTITVASGQLCQVLLTKPLHLPAIWQ